MKQIVTTPMQVSIWKNKTFSLLLVIGLLLSVGNKFYEIVLPLIMLDITHSAVAMTSMRTAELIPNMLFGVFIGVIVDRADKKRWVLWMVGVQSGLLILLLLLFKMNSGILVLYYLIGFLLMTFNYGYFNAQVSLTKASVDEVHLTSANAKFSLVETLVSVLAPALTGLVFILSSKSDGILITVVCYLVSFILLIRLSLKKEIIPRGKSDFILDLREGWIYFKGNKILFTATMFVVFSNCSITVVSTTILFFGEKTLHLSASLLAVILSFSGLGGITGSLLAGKIREWIGIGKLYGLAVLINGLSYGFLLMFHHLISFAVALFFIGFAISMHTISIYTIRHEQTPVHLMGRIGGITGTIFRIGMPATMFLSGYMLTWWGTGSIFLSAFFWNLVIFIVYVFTNLWKLK
jgi:MFS family permease